MARNTCKNFDKKCNNFDKNMQTLAWFGLAFLTLTGNKMVAFGSNTNIFLSNTNSIFGQGGRYNMDSWTALIFTFATVIRLSRLRMVKKKEEEDLGER